MRTVADALQTFISELELTDRQYEEANQQRQVVTSHLQRGLSVKNTFISGSFGRSTAIRPLHDIDLFITLNRPAHEDLRQGGPDTCLKKIRAVLADAYPDKELPTIQGRSVNIQFSGTEIGFDIVPAFEDPRDPDVYEIPDRNVRGWIQSNPRLHKEYSSKANERAGKQAKPLVKALKHWNCNQPGKKPLRSFHLELMVYAALQSPPAAYADGIALLFADLAQRVMYPCPDPAGLGPDVAAGFSPERLQRAQGFLRAAADTARQALDAGNAGRTEEAHYYWRSLFGDAYPERGKAPGAAAPAVITTPRTAPDDPGKRFG
jgi:hypothetical protein